MKTFIHTSAWLAIVNRNDPEHAAFTEEFQRVLEEGDRLYTTNVAIGQVLSELKHVDLQKAFRFHEIVEEAWFGTHLHILWIGRKTQWDALKMWKRFPNLKLDVFDFASVILMNRRNIRQILTRNRDFYELGFKILPEK
jgi:predicted nucleic acid-binding protein